MGDREISAKVDVQNSVTLFNTLQQLTRSLESNGKAFVWHTLDSLPVPRVMSDPRSGRAQSAELSETQQESAQTSIQVQWVRQTVKR